MTLLKPGMIATYTLPDGTTIEKAFDAAAIPDPSTATPPAPPTSKGPAQ